MIEWLNLKCGRNESVHELRERALRVLGFCCKTNTESVARAPHVVRDERATAENYARPSSARDEQ